MSPQDVKTVNVLMVCLGICRSPMAEAVLLHEIEQRPSLRGKFTIHVDSAGTGAYHEGDDADERTVAVLRKHKVPISCVARKVVVSDYKKFDYILAMDTNNLETLKSRQPTPSKAYITLFGTFSPTLSGPLSSRKISRGEVISDPYYGGGSGFEKCYQQCVGYSRGFLDFLEGGEVI